MPLAPSAMQDLDGRDLAVIVAVDLAGIGLEVMPSSLALASAPSFIFTKNGIGVGLGDQAGGDVGRVRGTAESNSRARARRELLQQLISS